MYFLYMDFEKYKVIIKESNSLKEGLKTIFDKVSIHSFSKVFRNILKFIIDNYFDEYLKLIEELKTNDPYWIGQYFNNKLHFCPICGKPTIRIFCSNKCRRTNEACKMIYEKSKETLLKNHGSLSYNNIKKREETCLKKYGKETYFLTDEFLNKKRETELEKYGVPSYSKTKEWLEKVRKTTKEKYGVENYSQTIDWKLKTNKTCNEKYGKDYYMSTDDFINKSKETKLFKYGDEYYTNKEKIRQTFMKNYRSEHFRHCENLNKEFIEQNFIKDDKFLFNECAKYFNVSYSFLYSFKSKNNIDIPNDNTCKSRDEQNLYDFINDESKKRNDRTLICPYEIDILIKNHKIGIEYNGIYYHSIEMNKNKFYHLNKTILCENNGYKLLHIYSSENIDIWKSIINSNLQINNRIYARKCYIRMVTHNESETFLKENFLNPLFNASIRLGLCYKNEIVQLITFRKSKKDNSYILNGVASKKYCNIIGGVSKLFKYFLLKYRPSSIIAKVDRRIVSFIDNIYLKIGFRLTDITNPVKLDMKISKNSHLNIYNCGYLIYEYKK